MAVLLSLLVLCGLLCGLAAIVALVRAGSSPQGHDPKSSDLHGSNANFGNSLKGDNSNFGRGFYDE
jgi:hypothetical protein